MPPITPTVPTTPNLNAVPGENYAQYEAHVSGGSSGVPAGTSTNDFMKALSDRLLGKDGVVSSNTDGLTAAVQNNIDLLKKASETNAAGINAEYTSKENAVNDQAVRDRISAQEGFDNAGQASQLAILGMLDDKTSKTVRDLELQKTQALATGALDTASKISDLQFKQVEFQATQQQQVFGNLLNAAQLFLQQQSETRLQNAAAADQENNKATIALKYGISIKPGQSLDEVIAQAMPFASQEEKLNIEKMKAEIASANRANSTSSSNAVMSYTLNQAATVMNNLAHSNLASRKSTLGAQPYIDADVYMKLRDDFAVANAGKTSSFDSQFAPRLSPEDRARLGVGTAAGVKAEDQTQAIIDSLTK